MDQQRLSIWLAMAEGIDFVCSCCAKTILAWDEGNPYYFDGNGVKRYAYHPDENRARCIGNDSPFLCLSCGKEFISDSESPRVDCPQCSSRETADLFKLEGKGCPFCKKCVFVDSGGHAIS